MAILVALGVLMLMAPCGATAAPVNDNFASATTFVTHFEEEFEGEAFYFGSKFGYNWNATEESGEPNHVGGPSGASVWYSWTAPVSGEAKISAGIFSDLRLSIYTGDSLESLQLLSAVSGHQAGPASWPAPGPPTGSWSTA